MRADDAASDVWTDERIAILRQMWADGATAAAIAKCLGGLSRSAVLGKIHRLRRGAAAPAMPPNKEPAGQLAHRPRGGQRAPRSSPRASSPKVSSPKPPSPKLPTPELRPEEARRSGKTLLELTNDSCRWPHGDPGASDFFFCGSPAADFASGRPYCAHHARLAYSSAPDSIEDDDPCVVAVRHSPSIAPIDSLRRDAWRAPVNHSAPRWR